MAYLDEILTKINEADTGDKDKEEKKDAEQERTEEKPKDGLITYSDEFYKAFEK